MRILCFLLAVGAAWAEVHVMTLKQAVARANQQAPDVLLARLDRQRAAEGVRIAKDPFQPKVFGGSGAAYTSGFPISIEGSAPAIFQTKTQMALFNRSLSYLVSQARENSRGAEIDLAARQEEAVFAVVKLYLDAEQLARAQELATQQVEHQRRVAEIVKQRVAEGRELAIEERRAALDVERAKQRAAILRVDQTNAETDLAVALGFEPRDQVRAAREDRRPVAGPDSEEDAITEALRSSKEMRRYESSLQAKQLELRSYKARRLPTVDLVAQYSLLAESVYRDFFGRFQRHNWQLGGSITIPIIASRAAYAYAAQTEIDLNKLRTEMLLTRGRIASEARKAYGEIEKAELARNLARQDLDLAREQLSVYLAQYEEGRLPLVRIEEARVAENQKWIAYHEAQKAFEQARLLLLKRTGSLMAALQ